MTRFLAVNHGSWRIRFPEEERILKVTKKMRHNIPVINLWNQHVIEKVWDRLTANKKGIQELVNRLALLKVSLLHGQVGYTINGKRRILMKMKGKVNCQELVFVFLWTFPCFLVTKRRKQTSGQLTVRSFLWVHLVKGKVNCQELDVFSLGNHLLVNFPVIVSLISF